MEEWVFVDTCIWASFFAKPGSPEKAAVDDLLDSDRVAPIGPILAEVLLGFQRKDQADWVCVAVADGLIRRSQLERLARGRRSRPRLGREGVQAPFD